MSNKHRGVPARTTDTVSTLAELCCCAPLSHLHKVETEREPPASDEVIPVPGELSAILRTTLDTLFPRSTPLSLLLLHCAQLEYVHTTSPSSIFHKRLHYHAPRGFLEQVLANVQRVIRSDDQFLTSADTAAALILPNVDYQGACNILERAYQSINLLQSETVIPPLKRETEIVMGVSSYPKPGTSIEHVLYHASLMTRKLTLRPAITTHLWARPLQPVEEIQPTPRGNGLAPLPPLNQTYAGQVPFLQLPGEVPRRLKQLIPYQLALELRCAPVGRDHHCLTVAMADPTNIRTVQQLCEQTGMAIFPVACDPAALNTLLAIKW